MHSMRRMSLQAGSDVVTCPSSGSSGTCKEQYRVDYDYHFDVATNHRVMGSVINPVTTRTVTYQEDRAGVPTSLSETTTYSIPVPTTFDPAQPPPVGGTTTITAPNGTTTVFHAKSLCTDRKSGACGAVVYKIENPDQSVTELGWASGGGPSSAPTGSFPNLYVRYSLQTRGAKARGSGTVKDANGNTTEVSEYDWFDDSTQNIARSAQMVSLVSVTPLRTTTTTYYQQSANGEYWSVSAPANLRAPHTVSVGSATTTFTYDDWQTTGNLTQEARFDSERGSNITRSWTYLSNGNIETSTDANKTVTTITYDTSSVYPTQIETGIAGTNKRTIKPQYSWTSGLLTSLSDFDKWPDDDVRI